MIRFKDNVLTVKVAGKLAHTFMVYYVLFILCLLHVVKKFVREKNANINKILNRGNETKFENP